MSEHSKAVANLPPEQEAIRAKCFHLTGTFVEFRKEDIEQSIPDRFENIVRKYPECIAVRSRQHEFTYSMLDDAANCIDQTILARYGGAEEPHRTAARQRCNGPVVVKTERFMELCSRSF